MAESFFKRFGSALVLMDADAPDMEATAAAVDSFFRRAGIPYTAVPVRRNSFIKGPREAELFISLLTKPSIFFKWKVHRSLAKFKVGRFQSRHGLEFDLVITDPSGAISSQKAVFAKIIDILDRIQ